MSDSIRDLLGETLTKIEQTKNSEREVEEVFFYCEKGSVYKLYHSQSCCEYVRLDDVCGDFDDLIGSKIIQATCVSDAPHEDRPDIISGDYASATWTFYIIATNKGSVTLRWVGTSNGYYSEEVDFALHTFNSGGNKLLPQ